MSSIWASVKREPTQNWDPRPCHVFRCRHFLHRILVPSKSPSRSLQIVPCHPYPRLVTIPFTLLPCHHYPVTLAPQERNFRRELSATRQVLISLVFFKKKSCLGVSRGLGKRHEPLTGIFSSRTYAFALVFEALRLIPVTGAAQKNRTRALPQANHINHPAKWSPTWRQTQCCQGHRGGAQAQPSPHRSGHHHRRGSKSALCGQEDRLRSCRRR